MRNLSILASHRPAVQILNVEKSIIKLFAPVYHLTSVDHQIVVQNVLSTLIAHQILLVLE